MINIIFDSKEQEIKLEGYSPVKYYGSDEQFDQLISLVKNILDKAYYSGETICLEYVDGEGFYTEVDRW